MENARQYTYATALTAAGISLAGMLDDEIRALIHAVSEYIDTLTDQKFNPVVDTAKRFEGRGRRIAYDHQLLPIVAVNSIKVDYNRADNRHFDPNDPLEQEATDITTAVLHTVGGTATLQTTDYVVQDRWIERLRTNWPIGPGAIVVDGVFGRLEPRKAKVETESAEQLVSDATQLTVDDTTGFKARDVALIGGDLYVIITEVPDGTTLRFDSVGTLAAAKAVDSKVQTWGAVPRAIQDLANHLFAQAKAEDDARRDGQQFVDPGRIKKELVDRYMYELFSSADSAGGWVTGSLRHDMTLKRYSRPAMAAPI